MQFKGQNALSHLELFSPENGNTTDSTYWFNLLDNTSQLVGLVGWASGYCEGGRGFKSPAGPTLTVLNNWGENATFVMTSANG